MYPVCAKSVIRRGAKDVVLPVLTSLCTSAQHQLRLAKMRIVNSIKRQLRLVLETIIINPIKRIVNFVKSVVLFVVDSIMCVVNFIKRVVCLIIWFVSWVTFWIVCVWVMSNMFSWLELFLSIRQ